MEKEIEGQDAARETPRPAGRYIVVNIGCLECGVSSDLVGGYADEAEAQRVADILDDKLNWREGGQNSFQVFDLSAPMADEYRDALGLFRETDEGGVLPSRAAESNSQCP
jgi:hypothetical protein